MSVGAYQPDVPLHTALAQVSDSLNTLTPALATINSSLVEGQTNLGVMETELNKIAGFTINTFDPVGVAVLASSGKRVAAFVVPAAKGALVGIFIRGVIHLVIF